MSIEALNWALSQKLDRSSAKFVLVAMANCANEEMKCWPSIAHLSEATCQDRKTVLENIKRLKELGIISDTDSRMGKTLQVTVFVLNKEYQKRDSTEIGTVPKKTVKSPVFPAKESRFSAETVPKTGHGTIKEPSSNQIPNTKDKAQAPIVLPDWLPLDSWGAFMQTRKKKKAADTPYAIGLILKDLTKFHSAGHDIAEILNKSIKGGWSDVYEPKTPPASAKVGKHAGFSKLNYREGIEEDGTLA